MYKVKYFLKNSEYVVFKWFKSFELVSEFYNKTGNTILEVKQYPAGA